MRRPPLLRPVSLLLSGLALLLFAYQQPSAEAHPTATLLPGQAPVTGSPFAPATRPALAPATKPARGPSGWVDDLDQLVEGHEISVAIGLDGRYLYRHRGWRRRPPASNEKLLLSMALLDRVPLETEIPTRVIATGTRSDHRLRGRLWIVGAGDPETDGPTMRRLARAVKDAGIRALRGRVMGVTSGFERDWWAPGWRDYFPEDYIALPTALTFEANEDRWGRHVRDPERRAAASLTKRLRAIGVRVTGDPGMGPLPDRSRRIAAVRSASLRSMLRRMNRHSVNFHAEVLGKYLGKRVIGGAGSIAKGARAIEAFAGAHGADIVAYDGSGLSYGNRVSPDDLVELLWFADRQAWGDELRRALPAGGQGTLQERLGNVRVRAKTGTLEEVSALSGWVWLEKPGTWGQFSILSQGMSKSQAIAIEDRVVRIVANRAS